MAFDPAKFIVDEPKSIPVLLLLDVSGSMSGDKIHMLNKSVQEMLEIFKKAETNETFIKFGAITFGSKVNVNTALTEVTKIEHFNDLRADGMTPMGTALKMAKAMIEDKEIFKGRDYRPTIVLISDGEPNDQWEQPLEDFINSGRSSKCDRLAMAIGSDANKDILNKFISGTDNELLYAEDAKDIVDKFKKITMSVTMRTKSVNKNNTVKVSEKMDTDDLDALLKL